MKLFCKLQQTLSEFVFLQNINMTVLHAERTVFRRKINIAFQHVRWKKRNYCAQCFKYRKWSSPGRCRLSLKLAKWVGCLNAVSKLRLLLSRCDKGQEAWKGTAIDVGKGCEMRLEPENSTYPFHGSHLHFMHCSSSIHPLLKIYQGESMN